MSMEIIQSAASAAAGGFKVKSNSRLFTREKMRAVSYTHLDVYKRQGRRLEGC